MFSEVLCAKYPENIATIEWVMGQNKTFEPGKDCKNVDKSRTTGMSKTKGSVEASTHIGRYSVPYLLSGKNLWGVEKSVFTSRNNDLFTFHACTGRSEKSQERVIYSKLKGALIYKHRHQAKDEPGAIWHVWDTYRFIYKYVSRISSFYMLNWIICRSVSHIHVWPPIIM